MEVSGFDDCSLASFDSLLVDEPALGGIDDCPKTQSHMSESFFYSETFELDELYPWYMFLQRTQTSFVSFCEKLLLHLLHFEYPIVIRQFA